MIQTYYCVLHTYMLLFVYFILYFCTLTWTKQSFSSCDSIFLQFCIFTLSNLSIFFDMYKNESTDVCLYVCLLVSGGLTKIQTPAPILMKFCTPISTCPRKVLVQV